MFFLFIIAWNLYISMIFPYYVTEIARITSNEIRDPTSIYHKTDPSLIFKDKLTNIVIKDALIPIDPLLMNDSHPPLVTNVNFFESVDDLTNGNHSSAFTSDTKIVLYSATLKVPYSFIYSIAGSKFSDEVTVSFSYPIYR